jgi:hypothetical protein
MDKRSWSGVGVWVGLEAVVIGFARTVLRIFSMSSRLGFGFPLLSDFLFIFFGVTESLLPIRNGRF